MAPTDINVLFLLSTLFTVLINPAVKGQIFEDSFLCPKSFGAFPDGSSCSNYWLCNFDQSERMSCPEGLYYNPKRGSCDRPENTLCSERNGAAFRPPFKSDELSTVGEGILFLPSSKKYNFITQEITTPSPRFSLRRKKIITVQENYPLYTTTPQNSDNNQDFINLPSRDLINSKGQTDFEDADFNNQQPPLTTTQSLKTYTKVRIRGRPGIFQRKNRTGFFGQPFPTTTTTTVSTTTVNSFAYLYEYDNEDKDSNINSNEVAYDEILETTMSTVPSTTTRTTTPSTTKRNPTTRKTTTPTTTSAATTTATTMTPGIVPVRGSLAGRKFRKLRVSTTTPPPVYYDYEEEKVPAKTQIPERKLKELPDAVGCEKDKCQLPNCRCGGTDIPGRFKKEEIPQIVMITFDDAVNDLNYKYYETIFKDSRVNPNGCPIQGTFYISHEWTNYNFVNKLYAKGHEFASHTIRHLNMKQFTKEEWKEEFVGQREILSNFGNVKPEDVKGIRCPFLQIGGDTMFEMLYENNFLYDSSITVGENNPPYFPYTLDYRVAHQCLILPCPQKSFPGIWEIPAVNFQGKSGEKCAMIDACQYPDDSQGVNETFYQNFLRHYTTNRAPLPLYFHAVWFDKVAAHLEGFMKFLETINSFPDVYIVTSSKMLEWMKNPTPLSEIKNFKPWKCDEKVDVQCSDNSVCPLEFDSATRYMGTCNPCPNSYPWVQNTNGEKSN